MCGIAGLVRYGGPLDLRAVEAMSNALKHRGPDGDGIWTGRNVALAHRRLALVDSAGGAQPIHSGRHVLVFNGEIYDHENLRDELDWPFRTRSDAETVLAACATWGVRACERFNGMFSFFYWDEEREAGFGCRDRLGVKPFAYVDSGGLFAFASEAKALVHAGLASRRVNRDAIAEYWSAPHFSGVRQSPFADVRYLQPGHMLEVDRDGVRTRQWWRWQRLPPVSDSAERLREALATSVAEALKADVDVGLFLSGGLDSSALAGWAHAATRWRGPAFAVDLEASGTSAMILDDDLPYARQVAESHHITLHEVRVPRAGLADDLRRIAIADDALCAWEQEVTQDRLAHTASQLVKAVLVGDAADETHYGYRFLLGDDPSPESLMESLGTPSPAIAHAHRELATAAGFDWEREPLEALTYLVVTLWLPRLLHNGDIHTMAHGLEARVPFADPRVVELAMTVGAAAGLAKAVLREAARGVVPENVRLRAKSSLPKGQDVTSTYQHEARKLLDTPVLAHLVDVAAIAELCDAAELSESQRGVLFRFICLAHWARHYEVTL